LHEVMIDCYYGQKVGRPSGFYTKVMNMKTKVQAVTFQINGFGTPLSKIPSGCEMSGSNIFSMTTRL
jgi:hypothetical protein